MSIHSDAGRGGSKVTIYCVRLKYDSLEGGKPVILLGRIEHEDSFEIQLKTGRGKIHRIPKSRIISITDTDIIFEEGR